MKISKIFHWLYFTVMMLPCVIIPIFAIYTRNENYNSNIEVQVQEKVEVDFNQESQITTNIDYTRGGVRFAQSIDTQTTIVDGVNTEVSNYFTLTNVPCVYSHKYLFKYEGVISGFRILLQWFNNGSYVSNYNFNVPNNYIYTFSNPNANQSRFVVYQDVLNSNMQGSLQINVYDLTQMGLEDITSSDFNTMFPNGYYPYTQSQIMYVDKLTPTTYNDTDVGSQFVYTLYNATDKYFNFNNFFGLDNVYSWIQLNWFSGNAPLGFAIFWHFFTYWLLASLAWLLFDVMVYVPLMIHRWMDKGAIE